MENDNLEKKTTATTIYEIQNSVRDTLSSILGIIVGVGGMLVAFLVSLLYSPKGSIDFREKFYDLTFWIMWGVILVIVIFVSILTYRITKKEAKSRPDFLEIKRRYDEAKEGARPYFYLLGKFTQYKNKEILLIKQREIVESADLDYDRFIKGEYLLKKPIVKRVWGKPVYAKYNEYRLISKYQQKRMKNYNKIKIKNIYPQDLIHDSSFSIKTTYSHLPQSEQRAESHFISSKMFTRFFTTFVFLLVGTLSFSWQGWVSAFTNAFGILMSWIGAIIQANEYVESTSKARYIAQTDLLTEFTDNVSRFIDKDDINNTKEVKTSHSEYFEGINAKYKDIINKMEVENETDSNNNN